MLPSSVPGRLQELKDLDRKISLLSQIAALLGWDQETGLPDDAVAGRSEQMALIEGQIHDLQTSSLMGTLTAELSESTLTDPIDRALVRLHKRRYERASRLPRELVERRARQIGLSQAAWAKARQASDFAAFAPYLETMVALSREMADCLGYEDHPYDALLGEYEPFTTSAEVKAVFAKLQDRVAALVRRIAAQPQVEAGFLHKTYPRDRQESFGRRVLTELGFNWNRGRLDVTTHPFCTSLGLDDVRITTRYDENFFPTAFYGMIHETGHALYEQGFARELKDTILAAGTSLGIHESQSRFWENLIGRSRPFVERYFDELQKTFPEALSGVKAEAFYRGINQVRPSLIRVEADEVTYSLHIILRFNLEMALLDGSLKVADVPKAWNDGMEALLGIRPGDDASGCLQDIHWSMGGLGYFPTYTLGNLYSAQFLHTLAGALPHWEDLVRAGDFAPILAWLRQHIHSPGSVPSASELCRQVTGEPLNPDYFVDYLERKYGGIYEL